jgi:uncharacterized membrane protein
VGRAGSNRQRASSARRGGRAAVGAKLSGASALGAAVVFFIAHNWGALGRYAKFGLIELLVLAAVLAYWRLGPDKASGKAALLVACILLGALLALVGQTYQTGADTYELFAAWAVLIAPWVVVGRYAALWLFWLALANLAVALYFRTFGGWLGIALADQDQLWVLFALNTAALIAWEVAARRIAWLAPRWAPRVVAVASGTTITLLALHGIVETRASGAAALAVYAAWLACAYFAYTRATRDVFVLAGGCLSVITVATTFLAKHLFGARWDAGAFLFMAMLIIGMAAAAGWWLKRLAAQTPP